MRAGGKKRKRKKGGRKSCNEEIAGALKCVARKNIDGEELDEKQGSAM